MMCNSLGKGVVQQCDQLINFLFLTWLPLAPITLLVFSLLWAKLQSANHSLSNEPTNQRQPLVQSNQSSAVLAAQQPISRRYDNARANEDPRDNPRGTPRAWNRARMPWTVLASCWNNQQVKWLCLGCSSDPSNRPIWLMVLWDSSRPHRMAVLVKEQLLFV